MPKIIFATPEEEKQWRENRPAYLKAYNKAHKQKPEYAEWQKNYRSTPEFKKGHKKYMKRYNRKKSVKAKQRTPEAKARKHEYYIDRKEQGKINYNPDYYKIPEVKERRNAAKREKRQKEKNEREELLASMTANQRKHFFRKERKLKRKEAKARKVKKAFRQLELKRLEADQILTQKAQVIVTKQQKEAHKTVVDRVVAKIVSMRESRRFRLSRPMILSDQVVSNRLTHYRNVIDGIREETEKAFGMVAVA